VNIDAWFKPVSARPLAALRIGLALVLLIHLAWISGDLLSLEGARGIIPWQLTDLLRAPGVPGVPTLAHPLELLGIGEHTAVSLVLSLYAGSLVALALGFGIRVSAFLAWILHVSLVTSAFASYYGADQLANTFLFYLCIFPSRRTIPVACLRVMQLHLCVVYLAAGVDKALGRDWWNGEAIWQAVSQPSFRTLDLSSLANHPWIFVFAGWATLVVEIGYPFFIWPRRTRRLWAALAIGFHLGTLVFMGLVFFSSVMILLTISLFLIPADKAPRTVAATRAAAVLASLFLASCSREPVLSADYDALVQRLMTRDRIPGVAIGVVDGGHVVFARGFGWRDVERKLPVTPDTLFALGSCSKAFTATAVALLADEGRVSLDAPVRAVLPDFTLSDPRASSTLTTRDLLTHRSGLPRHDLFWYRAPFSRDELYRRLRFLEPVGPPHVQWRYNSLMFVVAGRVVERVSGESWEQFVSERVLLPLGMKRTRLSPEAMESDADHAVPHSLSGARIPMLTKLDAIAPAGAVQSSANDLSRWLIFHATRQPALLSDQMWRELHRPQAEMPASPFAQVQQPFYALGWVHESYRGHPLVAHTGAIDGFTVHLGFLPETGQGVVVLVNRDLAMPAVNALAFTAYDRLLGLPPHDWEHELTETPDPVRDVVAVPLDFSLASVAGDYEHPAYGSLTVRVVGDELVLEFRSLRATLAYQGARRFVSREPITDGAPPISVRFGDGKLFVGLNFDDGDPVEVFTAADTRRDDRTSRTTSRARGLAG
jgi:CubicO group peptidase (beta-lactamase class C family)